MAADVLIFLFFCYRSSKVLLYLQASNLLDILCLEDLTWISMDIQVK